MSAGATIGDYEDAHTLRAFAEAVDVVTFEFENVSAMGLDLLASLRPVRPAPAVLRISQDRMRGEGLPQRRRRADRALGAGGQPRRAGGGGAPDRPAGGAEDHPVRL